MLARDEAILSSGAIASSATVTTAGKPGLLYGALLRSGTDASSLNLKDGGTSGTIKASLSLAGTTAAGETNQVLVLQEPVIFTTDIYATIAGTDAEAFVFYKQLV